MPAACIRGSSRRRLTAGREDCYAGLLCCTRVIIEKSLKETLWLFIYLYRLSTNGRLSRFEYAFIGHIVIMLTTRQFD